MWYPERPRFVEPIELLVKQGFQHFAPTDFEGFVLKLFEAFGFKGELTPITGDGGVDIIVHDENGVVIVQCKKYDDDAKIGVKELREFIGAIVHSKALHGYFVTTSDYTEAANEFASTHSNVTLINSRSLDRLFRLAILAALGKLEGV